MSNLSSNSLFHFTSSYSDLESILKNGLEYRWVAEKLPTPGLSYLIPMTCFCNIPLSMIEEHVDWYGKFAIGFKRSALRALGASPVFYLHSDSALVYKGVKSIDKYKRERFLPYFKQFYGKQFHRGLLRYKYKKFYDEKEWRLFTGDPEIITYKDLIDLDNKRQAKKDSFPVAAKPLSITLDMIEYIILENRNYLPLFKTFVSDTYPGMVEDAMVKVLFYNQIRRDF